MHIILLMAVSSYPSLVILVMQITIELIVFFEGQERDQFLTLFGALSADYKVNEASSNSTKPVSKGWFLYGHNAVGITYEIGDATPKKDIKLIGKVSAEQMMNILTKTND